MRITVDDHCMSVSDRTGAVVDLSTGTAIEWCIIVRTKYCTHIIDTMEEIGRVDASGS